MDPRRMKRWLFLSGLVLIGLWTASVSAQSETPSVLDRVRQVEDPELGDLIRMAIENRKRTTKAEAFDIVRQVTQSYAQIKLLDLQVEQIAQQAGATTGPAEMRYELLLAKAELESKRATELANLREMVGIIPELPLEEQATSDLSSEYRLR